MTKFNIEDSEKFRLDRFLTMKFPKWSRTKVQRVIKDGGVLINGERQKQSYRLQDGDDVYVKEIKEVERTVKAEDLNLEVLYEDDDFLVINKPAGMVVHPSEVGGHFSGTVVNGILAGLDPKAEWEDELRPGIVHRIDKETSGVLLTAKNVEAYKAAVKQFKIRTVSKYYLTLVEGAMKHPKGIVDSPIGRDPANRKKMAVTSAGKTAVSIYELLETFELKTNEYSFLRVEIKTGRTHQIRVHLKAIGHAVVGDGVYGRHVVNREFVEEYELERQFLHAEAFKFKNMAGEDVFVEAPLSDDLKAVLNGLRG